MSDDERLRLVSPAALGQPTFVEWDRATGPSGMKCPPAEVAVYVRGLLGRTGAMCPSSSASG